MSKVAVASVNWSAASTWSPPGAPTASENVTIPTGVAVTVDDTSATCLTCDVLGTLLHATNANTRLTVRDLTIEAVGKYHIGTSAAPIASSVLAEVVFQDIPFDTSLTTSDPYQSGCGILDLGELRIYGADKTPFGRLAASYAAGVSVVVLDAPVSGWRISDQLLLTDGRQDLVNGTYHPELRTLLTIGADNKTLTLSSALTYAKPRAIHFDGTLDYCSHVINMTRNVHLRSANPAGTRGVLFEYNAADCDCRNFSLLDMGRSRGDVPYDNTTTDNQGNVTHVGTNQDNHFALQQANLYGPATVPASGWQSVHQNFVVWDTGALLTSPYMVGVGALGWWGLFKNGVVVNKYGCGILNPVGFAYNRFEANFVAAVIGTGQRGDGVGHGGFDGGNGYFVETPLVSITGNIAANINPGGNYSYGLTMQMPSASTTVTVPAVQGANPAVNGVQVNVNQSAITWFQDDEYYACPAGFTVWNLNSLGDGTFQGGAGSAIAGIIVWNCCEWAVFIYPSEGLTIDGLEVYGDPALFRAGQGMSEGVKHADYGAKNFTLSNATIESCGVGYTPPVKTGGTSTSVSSCHFACGLGIDVTMCWSVNADQDYYAPTQIVLDNCTFNLAAGSAIVMDYPSHPDGMQWSGNLTALRQVVVTRFQANAADHFSVYWTQQAASYIVPQTVVIDGHVRLQGSPVAGLTNQQNWVQYGLSIGGAVAPANAGTRSGIGGLTA